MSFSIITIEKTKQYLFLIYFFVKKKSKQNSQKKKKNRKTFAFFVKKHKPWKQNPDIDTDSE